MCLGMSSELNEVMTAHDNTDIVNISEELADIMWYVANYCNFRRIDLESIYTDFRYNDENRFSYPYYISKLSDLVKKYVAYNKTIDEELEETYLCYIVHLIREIEFVNAGIITDHSFEKSLENNINKLKVRYPEKFTEEQALNRNLELERVQLEAK